MEVILPGRSGTLLDAESRDALTLVGTGGDDVCAFKGLVLELMRHEPSDAATVWHIVAAHNKMYETWRDIGRVTTQEEWDKRISGMAEYGVTMLLPPAHEAALALATIVEIWQRERAFTDRETTFRLDTDVAAPLFFSAAQPPPDGSFHGEIHFREPAPAALLLQPGSRIARLVLGTAFQLGGWAAGIAARRRSPEAAAVNIMTRLRERRARTAYPLLRLDQDERPTDRLAGKNGVIVFLHGLLSTDLGTFDAFIQRWLSPPPRILPLKNGDPIRQHLGEALPTSVLAAIAERVALVGWPHDTMVKINKNAQDLAASIDRALGAASCRIAFVCHSRGGLVARATAEKLFHKDPRWLERIACAITFGTPHDGAEFAEHPESAIGSYLLAGYGTRSLPAMIDALAYAKQRGAMEGVRDLRPRSAPGSNYLERLTDNESRYSPSGPRRLTVAATGSNYHGGAGGGPLVQRLARAYVSAYTGQSNDLVVTTASAVAGDTTGAPTVTDCDHFSYFEPDECTKPHVDAVIGRLWQAFELTAAMDVVR